MTADVLACQEIASALATRWAGEHDWTQRRSDR